MPLTALTESAWLTPITPLEVHEGLLICMQDDNILGLP